MGDWFRSVCETSRFVSSNPSLEYLYCIYCGNGACEFYRLNLNGGGNNDMPPPFLRLRRVDFPFNLSFVALGSTIYLLGGFYFVRRDGELFREVEFVRDIYAVETQNGFLRKIPNVLHSDVNHRVAVAIGGKIYTFPLDLTTPDNPPPAVSRFEVFDPSTETCTLLPDPNINSLVLSYFVLQNTLVLSGRISTFLFNTALPHRGWHQFRLDRNSSTCNFTAFPSAAVLIPDDRRFFGLPRQSYNALTQIGPTDPVIARFVALGGEHIHSIRLGGCCRVLGLQKEWRCILVPHRGNLLCSYTRYHDEKPQNCFHISNVFHPTFKQYSLDYRFDPQLEEYCYVAEEVRSFEYKWECDNEPCLLASFVIPASV